LSVIPHFPHSKIDSVHGVGETIVIVSGEVDLCTAPWLEEELRRCQEAAVSIIVDLERVEFMDCAALRVLVNASAQLGPARFSVALGSPQVRKLFELTGMTAVLHVIPRALDRTAA
jgi:anti-anti-sigma factor